MNAKVILDAVRQLFIKADSKVVISAPEVDLETNGSYFYIRFPSVGSYRVKVDPVSDRELINALRHQLLTRDIPASKWPAWVRP